MQNFETDDAYAEGIEHTGEDAVDNLAGSAGTRAAGLGRQRQINLTPAHLAALKARHRTAHINASGQIRLALEAFINRPAQPDDRLLLSPDAMTHRKLVPIAAAVWDELWARKEQTGLDLDEQVQIALTLYFTGHRPQATGQKREGTGNAPKKSPELAALEALGVRRASQLLTESSDKFSPSQSATPDSALGSGPRPLASNPDPLLVAARIVLSNAALEAEQGSAVPLISLPSVPCGPWREAINEGSALALPRELADILGARPGDLLVPTDGQSMVEAGVPDGGRVVMRPLNGRHPQIGEVVLCCIEREDGMWESTIKFWFETPRGAPLLKNGKLQAIPLPADLVEVHPVASLIGVMGRATFGTPKGLSPEARQRRRFPREDDDPLAQ